MSFYGLLREELFQNFFIIYTEQGLVTPVREQRYVKVTGAQGILQKPYLMENIPINLKY